MDTSFSYQSRVAACDRCGGPSEVEVSGGSFACRFCNAQNQLDVRDEALVAPARQPMSEPDRIARLRMQDGQPLLPPPSLMQLFQGGQLQDWKVDEAVAIWNATRQELKATRGSSYEAAERLVFLAMVLSQRFQHRGEKLRQRQMLEGTLDAVALPRHRQIMRGYLARAAVRSGDIKAAEAWIRPCDTASDDLQMDSAWRFSRAFIDTALGDFQRVLQVLGQSMQDVPIEDSADDVCAVFRANAWEKLGRPDFAVNLLRERMAVGGGSGRQTIERVVTLYTDWQVCALSYPQASAGHAVIAGQAAARRASGGIHVVFVPLGALMFVGGIIGCVWALLAAVDVLEGGAGVAMGAGITGATLLLMGFIFGGIGLVMKKSAEKAAWLRMHGLAAQGQVQEISPTGLEINGVPQVMFTLLVTIPGRAPYQATAKSLGIGARMRGANVPLRVHPQNPHELIIEAD